jgi:hypothetical protein
MQIARLTRATTAALLILVLAFASACGSKSSSSAGSTASGSNTAQNGAGEKNIHLPTAKFLLHAGLAFGAFHRYIYKPFKQGTFSHPLRHKLALIKAAAATAFVVHEVRLASEDAKASALLRKLLSPLTALAASVGGLASGLKGGHPDAAALGSANSQVEAIKGAAASQGIPVKEIAHGAI